MFKKVIIVDNPRAHFDISGLEHFGLVVNIRDKLDSPFKEEAFERALISALEHENFDVNTDYVALVGRQMQLALSIATIIKTYGDIKLLLHSTLQDCYVERNLKCPILKD